MKFALKLVGLIFHCLWFIGFLNGCSELEGLRIANSRQAITIRDQLQEIDRLTDNLSVNRAVRKDTVPKTVNTVIRNELERLAVSIGKGLTLEDSHGGPVIAIPDELLFDSGLAVLKREGSAVLGLIASHLRGRASLNMRIDGHAILDPDMMLRHGWVSDQHLSAERALSVLHYFIEKESINPQRMFIVGYGSYKPQVRSSQCEVDVQKGRVEFRYLNRW